MNSQTPEADQFRFLAGGGEMGGLIRAFDWSKSPLGALESWPQSLKTSVSLMLNSQHPMWIGWGPQATFLYNDAYIQVLSLAKHPQALGKPASEVWAEIWDICGPLADKVFQRGEPSFMDEVRLFMSRGDFLEETFYSFSYSPIRDESGNVGGLFCPSAEITSKILNTRRLRTLSELTTQSLMEKSVEGACASAMAILDRNRDDIPFALLYVAEPSREAVQLEQAAGISKGNALISPSTVEWSKTGAQPLWPIAEVMQTGRSYVVPLKGVEGFPLGAAAQPVVEALVLPMLSREEERPLAVLIVGVNPTRKLDSEYRAFFDMISGHVTTAIQNARASQEEKRRAETLAELDRAKTTFFSNVSHELRTPLTLILGPLEDEMREQGVPRERLEVVHRNSLRLLKLVNTLLDFSRLEAGRMEASYEPTDLAVLTAELASVFRSGIEKAGLKLRVDCPPLSEPVYVDRDMWEKIVFNLLSNAFKFTFEGEIHVQLREVSDIAMVMHGAANGSKMNADVAGKRGVCFMVSDTGSGIPATELPRIFERFHRVRNARSRSHEGTGIGLALVQELARQHGGGTSVDSVEGKGSTFIVAIPMGKVHLPKERIGAARMLSSTSAGATPYVEETMRWLPSDTTLINKPADMAREKTFPGTGLPRILLADDNADMREYIQRLLTAEGYAVTAVENGEAALASALREPPALVLSDVMMPLLDGFGLLKKLREDAATRAIPVLLISARAGEESRMEGVEAGADDYLTKPFSARELIARVRAQLELARIRKSAVDRERTLTAEALAAKEMAESANRSKDRFLAALSHELRTPLTPVLMTAATLHEDERLPADAREQLGMMERNIALEARLIDDLLDLTAISTGKLQLHSQPCDAHELIRLALEIIADAAQTKGVAVECRFEAKHTGLMADPTRFQQVIWNLLRNAVKFTPQGGRIVVKTADEPGQNRHPRLRVEVTDTGIGIEKPALEKIFLPFEQGRVTGDHRFGGLGLGLAIARAIVDLHGGQIRADSPGVNQGAIFIVELPVMTGAVESLKPATDLSTPTRAAFLEPAERTANGHVRRVLLVEDHAPTLQVLSNLLGRSGYQIVAVSSVAGALEAAAAGKFDVVISDLGLPDGTGIQLMEKLRRDFGLRGIALTGYGMEEDIARAREAGFVAHLIKPVHIAELRRILASLN